MLSDSIGMWQAESRLSQFRHTPTQKRMEWLGSKSSELGGSGSGCKEMDPTQGRREVTREKWKKATTSCHTPTATPQPRGQTCPHFSGDARSGKSSHPHVVCTPVQPSSTPVSLRYHFAVSGACSTDSLADLSDNLLSGYLYGSPSRGRNAGTFKDPGRHTARKWPGLEPVSRWEQNSWRWRPHPTRHTPFLRGCPTHEQVFLLRKWKAAATPLTQVQAPTGGSCLG